VIVHLSVVRRDIREYTAVPTKSPRTSKHEKTAMRVLDPERREHFTGWPAFAPP